jgi:hypothetical protein
MYQLRAGLDSDRLHGEMRQRAVTDRAEIVFTRIFLQQRQQFGDAVDLEFGIDHEHARLRDELRDGRDILVRVVWQVRKQECIGRKRAANADAEGSAIGRCFCYDVGGEIAARAWFVFDQECGVGVFLHQGLGDEPRHDVGRRSGPERN